MEMLPHNEGVLYLTGKHLLVHYCNSNSVKSKILKRLLEVKENLIELKCSFQMSEMQKKFFID